MDDRAAFNDIRFVLFTGIPSEEQSRERGRGSGMTGWRRLRQWQHAGMWERWHLALLNRRREYDQFDGRRASIDAARAASPGGAWKPAPTPPTAANAAANAT